MTNNMDSSDPRTDRIQLGAVSFLNAKPLVAGLAEDPRVELAYSVPSGLFDWLCSRRVQAALIPVVDLVSDVPVKIISDACIASDGETLTVRVFSRVPPGQIRRLVVDGDSHTSIILASVVWQELFSYAPPTMPLVRDAPPNTQDGVLLIGDKVIAERPRGFAFEVDLGAAWRERTGLPFVYAVWATLADTDTPGLAEVLSVSRNVGVERVAEIAEREAPRAAWPVEVACRYLTEYMDYTLTDRHRQGMDLFLSKAEQLGLLGKVRVAE